VADTVTNAEIVLASFDAFRAQDAAAAERLMADDFIFTSPQDDRIDRAVWLEKCFPTADHFAWQKLLAVTEVDAETVLAYYEYELQTGERFRNTEIISVRGGLIAEVQVFFGGRVP
jgi:ketosteroid isomerase-like protein